MMITVRHLLVVSFLVLLSGCAIVAGECSPPSSLPITRSHFATTASKCSYVLTVTKIDPEAGWVTGKYPQYHINENNADPQVEYKFLVKDLVWWKSRKLLVEGQDYIFIGDLDSAFVQPYFIQSYKGKDESKDPTYKGKDESKDPKNTPY